MKCAILFLATLVVATHGGKVSETTLYEHALLDQLNNRLMADAGNPLDAEDFRRGALIDINVPDGMDVDEEAERGKEFEGDIKLTAEQREVIERGIPAEMDEMRSAAANKRWPKQGKHANVAYTITNQFNQEERALIARGFDDYHKNTCIRLIPRTNQRDYIAVFKGDKGACWSMIGRTGGMQKLSLGDGCPNVGVVVHEFMHALGYWHEQSRSDRDNYIKVHWNNIEKKMKHNFNKCTTCDNQGIAYDTTSVMQYATWAFAKNKQLPSMTKIGCPNQVWPKDPKCKLGQYDGLAATDIQGLNMLYQCGNGGPANSCEDNPDQAANCFGWARKGYCQHWTYAKFMKDNCKKTCGCPTTVE